MFTLPQLRLIKNPEQQQHKIYKRSVLHGLFRIFEQSLPVTRVLGQIQHKQMHMKLRQQHSYLLQSG